MRVKKQTIPSAFVKTDDTITDPDECVNVHDLHTFRQNHNILVAQRIRKDLMAQASTLSYLEAVPPSANGNLFYTRHYPDGMPYARVMSVPLYLTQMTKEIRFWIVGCKWVLHYTSEMDDDPLLYVTLREPQLDFMYDDIERNTITVTAAVSTPTHYYVDVAVPPRAGEDNNHFGRLPYILDVHAREYVDDTRVQFGPHTVTDVGPNWYQASSATGTGGNCVYSSNTLIEPRLIVNTVSLGGGVYKYYMDADWNIPPIPGTDTISGRQVQAIQLMSWGVQELAITSFGLGLPL